MLQRNLAIKVPLYFFVYLREIPFQKQNLHPMSIQQLNLQPKQVVGDKSLNRTPTSWLLKVVEHLTGLRLKLGSVHPPICP